MSSLNTTIRQAPAGRRPATASSDWRDRGGCVNRPEHWWDDDAAPELQLKAREICLSCPVFAECLKAATAGEAGYDFGRSHTKAGLVGRQRDWLYRHSRKYGPYDAEEARLLALEARVSGRKVEEIAAREGVQGATVRLAARLLVGLVDDGNLTDGDTQTVLSASDKAQARLEDILRWRSEGTSLDCIAERIGVSRRIVTKTLKDCLGPDWSPGRKRGIAA
ncbi:WhiB family transcriptional regulator [Streptomyces asiaticus]|uniref:WhiB family transcriptional regulator n=1 Tax=Streptomyces asiaticus TaxID=114695 RepID=UPI003814081C